MAGSEQGGDHLSILGNTYFDVILVSTTHFTLVQENELSPAATVTVLYSGVSPENVSTIDNRIFLPKSSRSGTPEVAGSTVRTHRGPLPYMVEVIGEASIREISPILF